MSEILFNYDVIEYETSAAVTDDELEIEGELLLYHRGSEDITVKLNSYNNAGIPLSSKEEIQAPFTRLFITTTGSVDITFFISKPRDVKVGGKKMDVDAISAIEKTANITVKQVSVDDTAGGTLLLAANTGRKQARFKVKPSDSDLFVGESGLTVSDGYLIEDGAAEGFSKFTGAWYGICAAAGSCTVYVIEEG